MISILYIFAIPPSGFEIFSKMSSLFVFFFHQGGRLTTGAICGTGKKELLQTLEISCVRYEGS